MIKNVSIKKKNLENIGTRKSKTKVRPLVHYKEPIGYLKLNLTYIKSSSLLTMGNHFFLLKPHPFRAACITFFFF